MLSSVLESCIASSEAQQHTRLSDSALKRFVDEFNIEKYQRSSKRIRLPLQFEGHDQEINFHCMMALLSFGGAHEPELRARTGNSIEDTVKFGLIGTHLSRERMDATWMANITVGDIAEAFRIPVRDPTPTDIPGVTVEKPGPLVAYAEALRSTLNKTGASLLQMGYADMAQFVLHIARSEPGAEGLVRGLSSAFEAFKDTERICLQAPEGAQGAPASSAPGASAMDVVMLKNAQLLAGELHGRMGEMLEPLLYTDVDKLTAVADADVITGLIALGIMEPCPGHTKTFDPPQTGVLRAVAIQACHDLAKRLGPDVRPHELSLYIRRVSRKKEYSQVARFVPHPSLST